MDRASPVLTRVPLEDDARSVAYERTRRRPRVTPDPRVDRRPTQMHPFVQFGRTLPGVEHADIHRRFRRRGSRSPGAAHRGTGRVDTRPMVIAGSVTLVLAVTLQLLTLRHGGHGSISDLPHLFLNRGIRPGVVPYVDRPIEYPVLAGFLLYTASLVWTSPIGVLLVTTVAASAVFLTVTVLLARRFGARRVAVGDRHPHPALHVPELGPVRDRRARCRSARVRTASRRHRRHGLRRRWRDQAVPARRRPTARDVPLDAR